MVVTLRILKSIQSKKASTNITTPAFTNVKLKQVNDVLLYRNFLFKDHEYVFANDPVSWVVLDFDKWKSNGYPLSTAALNASQATNSTNTTQQTSNVTALSGTKLKDDALLSWRKSKHDVTLYPIIDNDLQYPNWILRIRRQFIADKYEWMIDLLVSFSSVIPGGSDILL